MDFILKSPVWRYTQPALATQPTASSTATLPLLFIRLLSHNGLFCTQPHCSLSRKNTWSPAPCPKTRQREPAVLYSCQRLSENRTISSLALLTTWARHRLQRNIHKATLPGPLASRAKLQNTPHSPIDFPQEVHWRRSRGREGGRGGEQW